jgi:HEPN domain-containing protein
MRKDTNNFIKSAEYDLNTAEFMLKSEIYNSLRNYLILLLK